MLLRVSYQNGFLLWDGRTRGRTTTTTQLRTGSVRAEKGRPRDSSGRYERVDMENAGAYRLIDKETGERVIVWGGADDAHDGSIPSSDVLSWRKNGQIKGSEGTSHDSVIAGFGRLKAQKVKSLIKRSSQLKKAKPLIKQLSEIKKAKHTSKKPTPLDDHKDSDDDNNINTNNMETLEISEKRTGSNFIQQESDDIVNNEKDNVAKSKNTLFDVRVSKDDSHMRGWGDVSNIDYYSSFDGDNTHRKFFANDRGFFSKKSFVNIGCSEDMINALRSLMFLRPSHIQAMAYGPVLQGKSCIIADQSGSGKTLAYLAPIIQGLRQEEALGHAKSSCGCPKVIILAPTAELASQVLNNCRSISRSGVPFRSMVATGGFKQKTQLDSLEQGVDVLIATPGRFLYLFQEGFVKLSDLKCVVLDEVDILYGGEGFQEVVEILIGSAPLSVQYLFVTATLPLDIYNKVVGVFPDCEVIMGPSMHRTSPGLEEVLVDCSGAEDEERSPETAFSNKKNALLNLVKECPVPKTIIFCNKIESCRKVENVLKRVDRKEARIRVLSFHAALTQDMCKANMKEFLKAQSADSMFLVCTDRASRGIDFEKVDHVVLFDFPREPSEYVRRVGRTARGAGGVGKAFVFVVGKQVTLARKIMDRNSKGHPLHDVPGAYELSNSSF